MPPKVGISADGAGRGPSVCPIAFRNASYKLAFRALERTLIVRDFGPVHRLTGRAMERQFHKVIVKSNVSARSDVSQRFFDSINIIDAASPGSSAELLQQGPQACVGRQLGIGG